MDFWRAVGILNNRKWLIVLSVIAATSLTWGATRLIGAKWVAEVRFMALGASPMPSVQQKGSSSDSDNANQDNKGSQRDIDRKQLAQIDALMKSPDVVRAAIKTMGGRPNLPDDMLNSIELTTVGPGLYQMQYTDTSPARALVVANAMAKAFVDQYQNMRTDQVQRTTDQLQGLYNTARDHADTVRKQFDTYRSEKQLQGGRYENAIEGAAHSYSEANLKITDLRQKLADSQAQLTAKTREYNVLPRETIKPGAPVPNLMIGEFRKELYSAQKEYNTLSNRYTADHPGVKKAKADVDRLTAAIDNELKHPITGPDIKEPNPDRVTLWHDLVRLKGEVAGYSAQMSAASAYAGNAKADLDKYKTVDLPMTTMAQELQRAGEMRDALQQRLTASQLQLDAAKNNKPITVIADVSNEFNPPMNATKGRTIKLIVLAFLGALIGTCAIVVALDSVDRRLKTVGQADLALPARIIAAIPQPMGNVSYSNLARATEINPSSLHSEAYRFLGLHLLSPRGPKVRSLMVLSAKAEQGSTTTVTNLAITLAQAGKRVILVDGNMRTAELHQVFETPNEFGFTDLLRDPSEANVENALRPTGVANLQIITSGPLTDNAWQLFRSDNLIELSRMLHERADFVLYDTPSALIFTDALNLAPVVDAAFLCVRALEPLTGAEQRVVELLEQNNVTVLGSVLNDVPASVVEGFHNYQHYYGGPASNMPAITARTEAAMRPMIEMPKSSNGGGVGKNGLS